jgi:hypothetical protein
MGSDGKTQGTHTTVRFPQVGRRPVATSWHGESSHEDLAENTCWRLRVASRYCVVGTCTPVRAGHAHVYTNCGGHERHSLQLTTDLLAGDIDDSKHMTAREG